MYFSHLQFHEQKTNEEFKSRQRNDEIESLFPETEGVVPRSFDILDLVPTWLRDRHTSGQSNFVNFLQAYYDWLYSEYSGYFLDVGLKQFIDIDTIPIELLKHYLSAYAPSFPMDMIGIPNCCPNDCGDDYEGNCMGVREDDVRNFIKGLRQNLYQRKTTEDAIRYFFDLLYGSFQGRDADSDTIDIDYPKKYVLRLNGGRFDGWGASERAFENGVPILSSYEELSSLSGSRLNYSIIQDSDWFQDFSYTLSTPLDYGTDQSGGPLYKEVYENLVHPIGMKVIYERTIADYIPPGEEDEDFLQCELAIVGNYYPYKMEDFSSINGCSGCGSTTGFGSTAGYDAYYESVSFDATIGTGEGEPGGYYYYMTKPGVTYGGATTENYTPAGPADEPWMFTGVTFNANAVPTHHYPYWTTDGITGQEFSEIAVGDFYYLCSPAGSISPNAGVTSCIQSLSCS